MTPKGSPRFHHQQRVFELNVEATNCKGPGIGWVLILSLFLTSTTVLAQEGVVLSFVARWLPAETLLDNTDRATAALSPMPGWVSAGGTFKNSFGMTFKTGPSEFLLRSVSFMIAPPVGATSFDGDLKVSLYEVPEGKFPPSETPFYESSHQGVRVGPKEQYVTLQLALPRLKPDTWYGIALSASNGSTVRIMGYQIPPRAPTPSLGFENGLPFWGEPKSWRSLGSPSIWVEGWDASSGAFLRLKTVSELGGGVAILLAGLFIFRRVRRPQPR